MLFVASINYFDDDVAQTNLLSKVEEDGSIIRVKSYTASRSRRTNLIHLSSPMNCKVTVIEDGIGHGSIIIATRPMVFREPLCGPAPLRCYLSCPRSRYRPDNWLLATKIDCHLLARNTDANQDVW